MKYIVFALLLFFTLTAFSKLGEEVMKRKIEIRAISIGLAKEDEQTMELTFSDERVCYILTGDVSCLKSGK